MTSALCCDGLRDEPIDLHSSAAAVWPQVFSRLTLLQDGLEAKGAREPCLRVRHVSSDSIAAAAAVPRHPLGYAARLSVTSSQLQAAFEITGAEALVLMALMDGEMPKTYALRKQVSVNTVRSHIRSLLGKMDCQRQIDLVRTGLFFAWSQQAQALDADPVAGINRRQQL